MKKEHYCDWCEDGPLAMLLSSVNGEDRGKWCNAYFSMGGPIRGEEIWT